MVLMKQAETIEIRMKKELQNSLALSCNTIALGIEKRAHQILYHFLYDSNKIFQLIIKG
jgi:hypothetical protein